MNSINSIHEIVIFEVSDSKKAIEYAGLMLDEVNARSGGILKSETYRTIENPAILAQRIEWKSIDHAKKALDFLNELDNAKKLMPLITKTIHLGHFSLIREK